MLICALNCESCGQNSASNKVMAKNAAYSAMRKLTNFIVKSPCAVAHEGAYGQFR